MSPAMHGGTTSWSIFTVVALVVIAVIYLRGWYRLRKVRGRDASEWCASAFLGGELLLAAAVASPLARLDHHWLTAHMAEHLVLMTLAAPLVLLGEPALMFRNSLPEHVEAAGPDPASRYVPIRRIALILSNPVSCWLAGTVCVLVWHIPGRFDLSMRS